MQQMVSIGFHPCSNHICFIMLRTKVMKKTLLCCVINRCITYRQQKTKHIYCYTIKQCPADIILLNMCCNAFAQFTSIYDYVYSNDNADNYEIYRRPVTAAQEIGVWNKDEPLRENESWTYVRRRVHLDSEMTRYVHH